jgi:hypothetical protein
MEVSVVTLFYSLVFSVVFVHGIGSLLPNVKAHAPLPAGANVDDSVGVVVTENHRN